MAARNLLAFDLGAESGRKLRRSEWRAADPGREASLRQSQWPAQWTPVLELSRPVGRAQDRPAQIRRGRRTIDAIGVDAWGVDFGFLDKAGDLLGHPFMYRDSQTDGMLADAFAKVPRAEIFEAAGTSSSKSTPSFSSWRSPSAIARCSI